MSGESSQFMWPKKPNNSMWFKQPAVYTQKMQSDPKKMQQIQALHKEDPSIKEVQSQRRYVEPKKMQPVMQPVKKMSPRCHKYHQSTSTEKK